MTLDKKLSDTGSDQRILFLAPHFDDFEFGCGGWVQTLDSEVQNHVCVLSKSDYVRSDGKKISHEDRLKEAENAARVLGGYDLSVLEVMEENDGYRADYGAAVRKISDLINDMKATHVYVNLPSYNQDHRFIFDVVMTCFRPAMLPGVRELWGYEYPGNCWLGTPPEFGKDYREISGSHAFTKLRALLEHRSQFEGREVGVCPKSSDVLLRQRGSEVGVGFAELFYLLRKVQRRR